ncbi:MAG: glycerol kinase GlpK [Bacteroidota bacterium]
MTKNQPPYIIAVDQSTSATKAMIFDSGAHLVHRVSVPHRQFYPQPGFVEHGPEEIYNNTVAELSDLIRQSGADPAKFVCLSITNQRETSMIWDRKSGKPIANAAVWQCQRGAARCDELKSKGFSGSIRTKTGLIIDSYFSASKLQWIINNTPGAKERAGKGDLLLGTMDTWLLWNLTGRKVHATDYSNACRTMLFNIQTLEWDKELIELFDLHPSMFPELRYSDEVFGKISDPNLKLLADLPVAGLIGDSHGALFGQHCFAPGMTKATYGTGSSIMMNIGKKPLEAPSGLVTSIGFGKGKSIDYVFEGNIHCTGDTINWLVNDLKLISSPSEAEQLAQSVAGTGGIYLVPAFVGLGAPYWDHEARAIICGMGRDATRSHVARAALESIAYQIKDLIDLMIAKSGVDLKELRVDGGPTRNEFLMQFQTDILQKTVVRTAIEEISALGSAFMAGLATGIWRDTDELEKLRAVDKTFNNKMAVAEIDRLYSGWKKAVSRTMYK